MLTFSITTSLRFIIKYAVVPLSLINGSTKIYSFPVGIICILFLKSEFIVTSFCLILKSPRAFMLGLFIFCDVYIMFWEYRFLIFQHNFSITPHFAVNTQISLPASNQLAICWQLQAVHLYNNTDKTFTSHVFWRKLHIYKY